MPKHTYSNMSITPKMRQLSIFTQLIASNKMNFETEISAHNPYRIIKINLEEPMLYMAVEKNFWFIQ